MSVMRLYRRFPRLSCLLIGLVLTVFLVIGAYGMRRFSGSLQSNSLPPIARWFDDPASRPVLTTAMRQQACPGAPFILPSDGFIGLLWNDPAAPYTVMNTHTGLDIFGDGEPGEVPVYAAYGGTLSRLADWKSSVIIRHDDPLQPGRTIWTYYTHMASRDGGQSFIAPAFPPGTEAVWVEPGTLLGYQGEYAGVGRAPIGLHLHFTIIAQEGDDPYQAFAHESVLSSTLDPSPYLRMPVNIAGLPSRPISCAG
ncbi:MAG TPA: hypothetical protein VHO69_01640 [Phototrophicaceae bacterium]|nr:hypothetical protein [Phototrophicaceae bacterium]